MNKSNASHSLIPASDWQRRDRRGLWALSSDQVTQNCQCA